MVIYRSFSIPVSLGIAPIRTLAKLANRFAKKYPAYNRICIINSNEKRIKALQKTEVGDIWEIGRRRAKTGKIMMIFNKNKRRY